ncbi:MAG: dihydroneopterin aldolase, partial [Nautilia sp.]
VIEDSLEYICSYLKNEFIEIKKIKLEILKPNILDNCIVGAKIIKKY